MSTNKLVKKSEQLINLFSAIVDDIKNDWKSKDREVYVSKMILGLDWGWTKEHSESYSNSTAQLQKLTEEIYKKNFQDKGLYVGPITKMFPYHRRMLLDRNKIKDIYDKDMKNVKSLFEEYLD